MIRHTIRQPLAWWALACLALLLTLYWPVFATFINDWATYPEYNYAFFVPPIALWMLWRRRAALQVAPLHTDMAGALLVGAGLLTLLVGMAANVHVVEGLSFIPTLLGLTWLLTGRQIARVAILPVTFLACGLGIFRGLTTSLGFAMQGITARGAAQLAILLGNSVHRDGLVLSIGHYQFLVADSCSGLGTLLSLLTLGWLISAEGSGAWLTRTLLFLAIAPMVVVANIIRVALVLIIAQNISDAIAEGFVHGLFSVVIFVFTFILLLILRQVLLWVEPRALAS